MAVNIIDREDKLESLLQFIKNSRFLAVDTEFNREKTFYPILGLFQICADGEIFLVDPIALPNFSKLIEHIVTTEATVIFHACHEDAMIIADYSRTHGFSRTSPINLYDTQVAASFLNKGTVVGLATLLKTFIGIELSKTETRTDWLARPFTEAQIEYAALDVAYLEKLHNVFAFEFNSKPQVARYFLQEMKELSATSEAEVDKSTLHIKLPGTGRFSENKLRVLQALSILRFDFCREHNVAMSRFIKNAILVELVDTMQITDPRCYIKKGINYQIAKKYGSLIAETAEKAFGNEDIEVVRTLDSVRHIRRIKDDMKHLEKYLAKKTKEIGISEDLINTRKYIQDFFYTALYTPEKKSLLEQGWRGEFLDEVSRFRPEPLK